MKKKKKFIGPLIALIILFNLFGNTISKADTAEGEGTTSFYGSYPLIKGKTQVSTKKLFPKPDQVFTDVWILEGLLPSHTYTITTEEYDLSTQKYILNEFKGKVSFVANEANQSINVNINGDASPYAGHRLVTLGKVTDDSGKVVLNLDNIHDENETLSVLDYGKSKTITSNNKNILYSILPKTGEEAATWISIIGLIIISVTYMWKRNKISKNRRRKS